jgi:hypothetical protein
MHEYAELSIHFLRTDEGGRSSPVDLSEDGPVRYRPRLRVRGSSEVLDVEVVDGPDDPVEPGTNTSVTVRWRREPEVGYNALVPGAEVELLEGSTVVARGRVTRR